MEVLILEVGKHLYTFSSLSVVMLITVSQTHGTAEVGMDLWRQSGPTPCPQPGPRRVNCPGTGQVAFEDFQGDIMHWFLCDLFQSFIIPTVKNYFLVFRKKLLCFI